MSIGRKVPDDWTWGNIFEHTKKVCVRLYKTRECARLARSGVNEFFEENSELLRQLDNYLSPLRIGYRHIEPGLCYEFRLDGFAMPGKIPNGSCSDFGEYRIKNCREGEKLSFMWLQEGNIFSHTSDIPVKSIVFW